MKGCWGARCLQVSPLPDLTVVSLQNLSGWMGKTGPSFSSPDEVMSYLLRKDRVREGDLR